VITNELRRAVFERDNHTCLYCGGVGEETDLEVDHIIPVSKGGNDDIRNLCTACWKCNRSKGARILTTNELQRIANKINSSLEYLMSLTSEEYNGEKKSEKLMMYFTPSVMAELKDLCSMKHTTCANYLFELACREIEKNGEALAFFREGMSKLI